MNKSLIILAFVIVALQGMAQKTKPAGSGLVSVNGTKIYYEEYGTGKPLVLLHGAFMTIDTNWGELIPELSKTRRVIAIESQSHGHSPYSDRKLAFSTLASDVEGILNHLKIDSADIIGYSFGGEIAYQLAIQSPKRVKSLVIISSTYKSKGWLPEIEQAFKSMKPEFFMNTPMHTAYDAVAPDKTKWTKFLDQMIVMAGTTYDLGDDNIAKIAAPALLIAGDNDGLDKAELGKTFKLLGGDVMMDMGAKSKAQLAIVPNQGHVTVMMQTPVILSYVNGFLK